MKKSVLSLIAVLGFLVFAVAAFAAESIPGATKTALMNGTITTSHNIRLALYATGADGSCTDSTYDTYNDTATDQTGDAAGYNLGTPTWATSSSATTLDQLSTLGADDTWTATTTAAITDADCAIMFVDTGADGLDGADDMAIFRQDVTQFSVGAGNDFDVTITTDGYAVSFD